MHPRTPSLLAILMASVLFVPAASAAPIATVDLGTAKSFAILAGSGITNTGVTNVTGDVGSYPTPTETGFGPGANSVTITGTNHGGDAVTQGAKNDLLTAYNDAKGRPGATPVVGGELGGLTLAPGVYADDNAPDSLAITGTLTLDGQGDPNSVWIFQSGSTLTTAADSNVAMINGAQPCHVFWQLGSSATLGIGSHLEGTIMASASITITHAATINGRVLAINGTVTMDNNTIQNIPCNPPPAPQNVSCSPTPSGVQVQWDAVTGATSYNVYRAAGNGSFMFLANVVGSPYEDHSAAPGVTYSYKITAVSVDGESAPSESCTSIAVPFFPGLVAFGAAVLGSGAVVTAIVHRRHR
jgi:Ice-binding-like